ncbi:MAG: alkaline phosphatase family protein [Caldilineaceae bacterium]|nr:alkaline phosphatase family protein [Caldilineaceae bacterium]
MRRVIFLFLDGVGVGADEAAINPLAAARMPTLAALMDGYPPTLRTGRFAAAHAHFIPTDAHLGVAGRPQSATGQTAILTGINAPARLGEHYGPRPDQRVRAILDEASLFARLNRMDLPAYFCNAYPERYFAAVDRGKRLLSAVPYAAQVGGQNLLTVDDLRARRALSATFTTEGWRTELGYTDVPLTTAAENGAQLWRIAQDYRFVFFEHWLTDYLGHHRNHAAAVENFDQFDGFLAGLLAAADLDETMIIVGSDHGNVEDCSDRKHTDNPALTLLLGAGRDTYADRIHRLDDFAPVIVDFLRG